MKAFQRHLLAVLAVEMVRMIGFALVFDVALFDNAPAFVADVLAVSSRLLSSVAITAQSSTGVTEKSNVSQDRVARFASKAIRVPTVVHGFDHSADDEFA